MKFYSPASSFNKMLRLTLILLFLGFYTNVYSAPDESFTDEPVGRDIEHPAWFKDSFLNLQEDLAEALLNGKKGIAVYFGQKHCAYCKALMRNIMNTPDINNYFRDNFDVVSLDIWGNREVTLVDGDVMDERTFSVLEDTNFTPSLIFFDQDGEMVFKMRGYYKTYRFRAMLKYIVEGYYKNETFRDYLARADPPPKFDQADLNEHDLFVKSLPILDRRTGQANKILAVIFEQPTCHACDQLHSKPLHDFKNMNLLKHLEIHQINGSSDDPVLTPSGKHKKAREWAAELGIHYYPTMLFFDEQGREIFRIDSVVKLYRLRGVLQYLITGGYKQYPTYQRWRRYTGFER